MAIISKYSLNGNVNDGTGTNNGTNNGISFANGKLGQCGLFNSSGYVSAPSTGLSLTTFNHSVWFYTGATGIQGVTAGSIDSCPNINLVNGKITLARQNQAELIASTNNYPLNAWVFVNINYTQSGGNGIIELYVNGKLNNTNTISNTFTTYGNFQIGRYSIFGAFNGKIDEVELYNNTLSATAIKNKYLYYNGFI